MSVDRTLLVRAIEAIIYVATEPVPFDRLEKVFAEDDVTHARLREALDDLKRTYMGRGVELVEVGGGYQMRTSPDVGPFIARLERPRAIKLSQAALETLAIVAYRQPATRADVEEVRGVDCGGVMRSLQERGLTRVVGKKDVPGRPLLYGTSNKFLEVFGLSSLTDLPTLRQIEEFAEKAEGIEVEEVFEHHNGNIHTDDNSGDSSNPGETPGDNPGDEPEIVADAADIPELPLEKPRQETLEEIMADLDGD
jgi:segregation and condensation protein B